MQRKSIFQLVKENYNIIDEAQKIKELFSKQKYFRDGMYYEYTLDEIITKYLFAEWHYRGTCVNTSEYWKRINAIIDKNSSQDAIINFLEAMDNFIELYFANKDILYTQHQIKYYSNFISVFCPLIKELQQRMGLSRRKYKDRIVLYPKNIPLENTLKKIDDEEIQWDLIRYAREDLTLNEKKKLLASFATKFEIEKNNSKKGEYIQSLIDECTNILNNLAIRHSNKDNKSQAIFKELSSSDQHALCDLVFTNIVTIINLRSTKKYLATYEKFKTLQKQCEKKA